MTTKEQTHAASKALTPYVNALLLATAAAQLERERVDKIKRKELEENAYYTDEGERVTDPRLDWRMNDESAARYYPRLNAIHLANGFEDASKGHCPALAAEHLQTQAEWALIAAAEEFFPGVTNDRLLCGNGKMSGLKLRAEWLRLLTGLVVNHTGYKAPAIPCAVHA
jgi:hypothetical protein